MENADLGLTSATVKLNATKAMALPGLEGLDGKVTADLQTLRYATFTTDSATVDAEIHNSSLVLNKLSVVRGRNSVSANGTYPIPQDGKPAPPITGEFAIQAPKIEEFGVGKDGVILGGTLTGSGKVQATGNQYTGGITLDGGSFTYGDFIADKLTARVTVADNEATIEQFALQVDKSDAISATGKAGVQAPFAYEGAVLVLFKNLGVLQPLLQTFGVKEAIGGSLDLSVESQGKIQPQEIGGQLKLSLDKAKYGTTAIDQVAVAGLFGPNYAETTQLHAAHGRDRFRRRRGMARRPVASERHQPEAGRTAGADRLCPPALRARQQGNTHSL